MPKSVNIFVLNWNGCGLTLDCLASLEQISYSNAKVIVIDNGSTDDSVILIREKYPDVDIIELTNNLRFAGGNNAGFKAVRHNADYTIFLNNDTIVDPHFIEPLVNVFELNRNVKQTAPKIYYADKPEYIWFAGGKVNLWTGLIRHIGIRKKDSSQFSKNWEIDYATGCCVCMRTEDFQSIGMFDESFPMYAEDVDLSLRFKQQGGKIVFIPESKIWHKVSASMGGAFSIKKLWRKQKGKWRLIRKHAGLIQSLIALVCNIFLFPGELFIRVILKRKR
ncbi:glycosyltransferase family 2 protein [Caldithrix abyssi]|nr:glycosyltransferase family 2 protein [Caldithrix abyssi]